MTETVRYQDHVGLAAIVHALENVRLMLDRADVTPAQAASYVGCINLHLAQLVGVNPEFIEQLQDCAGLLCPECQGFVGLLSNLAGECPHCGASVFGPTEEPC
jgi:hypothetical protein